MTTALTTPTQQPGAKSPRAIVITLILAVIAAVVVGVVGGLGVFRASAEAESARQAEAFAEVLPDTVNLAVNVSFERDAVVAGVPPVVLRPLRQTTDESAQAWRTRAQEIEDRDATLERITQELSDVDDLRTQIQNDHATGSERYTALTNDLFSIADDLPNAGEGRAEQSIEAIGHMPEAWASLGQERAIMSEALSDSPLPGTKPVSDEEIAALTEAEAGWRRSLAAFYEKSSADQREALDGLTNGTATKGATGVPAHQAVNDVIAGRSPATLDSYTASSTEFMRGLQEILIASAQEIVEDQRAARDDAVRAALVGLVLTVAVVGVLALLIVVLAVVLVILRRSASTRGARG